MVHLLVLLAVGSVTGARRRLTSVYTRPAASELIATWSIPVNDQCAKRPCSSQVHITLHSPFEAAVSFASATDETPTLVEYGYSRHYLDRTSRGTRCSYSQLLSFDEDLVRPPIGYPGATESELLAIMNTSSWAQGTASFVNPTQVKYGMQSYKNPQAYYGSPVIHHVTLPSLLPSSTVYFRVPNDDRLHSFRMPPEPGAPPSQPLAASSSIADARPTRGFVLGLCADVGQTPASNASVHALLAAAPDAVLIAGDLSYADGYAARWDSFANLFEPLSSRVPVLSCAGNHEVGSGEQWLSYNARWKMPAALSGSSDNTYFSLELGPVHLISLNSYAPTHAGSLQHAWLLRALSRVDRTRTPWLVVMTHAPFYCSNSGHVEETRLMRLDLEKLLLDAGVDLVLSGHVHAYERTVPTFDYKPDECGPVFTTIGDGGNREGAYLPWREPQPEWSAYREASFGIGLLEVVNATHARFEWRRHSCEGSADPSNINFNKTCESIDRSAHTENGQLLGVDQEWMIKPPSSKCANRWRSGLNARAPLPESSSSSKADMRIVAAHVPALIAVASLSLLVNVCLVGALVAMRTRQSSFFPKAGPSRYANMPMDNVAVRRDDA